MTPLISIIMPVYNCEDYIKESINSICGQTYVNWELIIVNDGSTDQTMDKIAQIKDKRIQVINNKEHQGLTSSFAEGYKLAKGEFILRHDGDDISVPTRLEVQENYLESKPEVGMVSCLISCFTQDPLFRKDCIFIERIQNFYKTYDSIKKATLDGFIPLIFPTLMIRKSIIDKLGYKNENLLFDDHTELLLGLIELCAVEKVNTVLYYYRRHKEAYHIKNLKQHEQYTTKLLNDIDIKNRLKYKDFYKDISPTIENKKSANENSPIRVLMLVDALNVGGTETHVINITKELIAQGIYVVVATSGGPMEGILASCGAKIIKLSIEGDYISNRKKMGIIKFLKSVIDEEKIDVIHCHLFASMQLASEIYRMYQIPYIVTIHGLFYPNDVLYSTCIEANKVIAVSEPVKQMLDAKLENRIHDKIIVLPNGISTDLIKKSDIAFDVRRELDIPERERILCYCSRLDWNKTDAARVFLFSFSQLIEEFPGLHALIIGDGLGKESIEKEAEIINRMVNKKIVHVIGAKANVIPYYLRSTIIIGTARVALEGMMCTKPVIAIGNHGYSGIIAERNRLRQWKMYFGDHDSLEKPNVSKLVRDIRYLMENPEMRREIGRWGRIWCEKMFSSDKIVNRLIQIYKNALTM